MAEQRINSRHGKYILLPFLLAIVFSVWQAGAHPMPNSVVKLSVLDTSIRGEARIPLIELGNAVGDSVTTDLSRPFFRQYFTRHIVASSDGGVWTTEVERIEITTDHDPLVGEYQEVVVYFKMTPANASELRHFIFHYDAVIHQVITHSIIVFIHYDWGNGIHEGSVSHPLGVIALDVPTGSIHPLRVDLVQGSWWKGFSGMFIYGVKHIREGLDHVLFLLTLLLVAPLTVVKNKWSGFQGFGYTFSRFFKISLAFTIGHSVTLLIGAFNLLNFQVQYVEVLIAFTIVVSAVNCVWPIFLRRETLLACVFGLIHGLAFSISISKLDLELSGKLVSVLGFNLGIEIAQLAIMFFFFPILLISRSNFYQPLRIIFAIFTLVVALGWLMERISNEANMVTKFMGQLGFA